MTLRKKLKVVLGSVYQDILLYITSYQLILIRLAKRWRITNVCMSGQDNRTSLVILQWLLGANLCLPQIPHLPNHEKSTTKNSGRLLWTIPLVIDDARGEQAQG